ncbi:MAG: cysteine--tRNA ligase [bacterium]|nr:cysteine--tRNA ligase [bacterium]
MLRLFNTLSRSKEEFIPIKDRVVTYYTCGPTVYNYAHIGNFRSYIFADTLKRVLRYCDYSVKHVMNITDVGHLTSDADSGEDKMLLAATREKRSVWDIAAFYTEAFMKSSHDLNIIPPDIICKATDHILEQIAMIEKLEKKGFAYVSGGNVYFDTSKLSDYGKLAQLDSSTPQEHRVDIDSNKKNSQDFVLWFTKSKFQDQDMKWESPWGIGYPGWHIECSAMSTHYLGQPIDIHTGGVDHIAVHHTNEIAQSEATGGVPFVKYWLHGEFLVVDEGKMAKSGGSFITVDTLKEKGYDPLAYRYYCLQAHYRQQLTFSWDALTATQEGLRGLRDSITRIKRQGQGVPATPTSSEAQELVENFIKQYTEALSDDLNTARALALVFELIRDINKTEFTPNDYTFFTDSILDTDRVFGLHLDVCHSDAVSFEVSELIELRDGARKEKNWKEADRLRGEIEAHGYQVEDADGKTHVIKK